MNLLPVPPRFVLVALIIAFILVRLVPAPTFTDAYYHFNAAHRLASGQGLTDVYLWQYIGAPDTLPAPSHLYWMPFTSLTAAAGMAILNAPGDHGAAQLLFVPMLAMVACVAFWIGRHLAGDRAIGWYTGLFALFSGYFVRFWGAIDTFTPYAFAGSLCLLTLALALQRGRLAWWAAAGIAAALGHLTRADGLLLLIIGAVLALWPRDPVRLPVRLTRLTMLLVAYLLVMSPWFARNLEAIGTPLPLGGTQAIWFRSYDDIFSFPPDASLQAMFADGLSTFVQTRWDALLTNLQTFFFVEGYIVLMPFMLIGLWRRRGDILLRPFWLYALGLHFAMTLVFPFPGTRGGLLHSAAALVPWWAALAVLGLHDAVEWVAKRRRRWNASTAKTVFTLGTLMLAIALSFQAILWAQATRGSGSLLYAELARLLPRDARVMANDPAAVYYHTGRGGVVLPNEAPAVIREIARTYAVDYLLIEFSTHDDGTRVAAIPVPLDPLLTEIPAFLTPVPLDYPDARLYVIDHTTP